MTALVAMGPWTKAFIGFAVLFLILAFDVIPGLVHALVRRPDERDTPDPDTPTEGDPQ